MTSSSNDGGEFSLVEIVEPLSDESNAATLNALRRVDDDDSAEVAFDRTMRALLQMCFPKEAKFVTQRFNNQMPTRRFLIVAADGRVAAHVAVHEKVLVLPNGVEQKYCGIAEVATEEQFRKRGFVKRLLAHVHEKYRLLGYDWSILMAGSSAYYLSSGYRSVRNVQAFEVDPYKQFHHPMVRALQHDVDPLPQWHTDEKIILNCPYF
jgi:predicted acetyltransferase